MHARCVSLSNEKFMIQPTLLIYILINTVKNFTTIDFRLNYMEVGIMIYTLLDND